MKKILLIVVAIAMVSCKKDLNAELKNAVTPYVKGAYTETDKITELHIYKIDTITLKTKYSITSQFVYDDLSKLKEGFQLYRSVYEDAQDILNDDPNNVEYQQNYIKTKNDYDEISAKVNPKLKQLDNYAELEKKADSTKFIAYLAKGTVKYVTAENVEKIDSISVIVNKDFKVIEKKDFVKDLL